MIHLINLSLYKRIILVYLCTARASSIADSFLAEIRDVHGFKFTAVGVMIFGITRVVAEPRHAVVWAISARGTYFVGILDNIVDITSEKKSGIPYYYMIKIDIHYYATIFIIMQNK